MPFSESVLFTDTVSEASLSVSHHSPMRMDLLKKVDQSISVFFFTYSYPFQISLADKLHKLI